MPVSTYLNLKESLIDASRKSDIGRHTQFTIQGKSLASIRSAFQISQSRYDKEQMFGSFTAPICNDITLSLQFVQNYLNLYYDMSEIHVFHELLTWKYSEFMKRMKSDHFEEYRYNKLLNKRHPDEIKLYIDIQNLIDFFQLAEQQNFSDFHNDLRDAISRNNYQQKLLQENQKSLTCFVHIREVMGSVKSAHFGKLQMAFLVEQINSNIEQRFVRSCRSSQEDFHFHYLRELERQASVNHALIAVFATNEPNCHASVLGYVQYDTDDMNNKLEFFKDRYDIDMQELKEQAQARTKFLNDLYASYEFQKKRRERFDIDLEILKVKYADEEDSELNSGEEECEGEED